jgi:hypothetical protein
MKRVLIVVAVLAALVLAGTTGYILGIRATVAKIEAARAAVEPRADGQPYNWCAVCHEYYPDWYCTFFGGCP